MAHDHSGTPCTLRLIEDIKYNPIKTTPSMSSRVITLHHLGAWYSSISKPVGQSWYSEDAVHSYSTWYKVRYVSVSPFHVTKSQVSQFHRTDFAADSTTPELQSMYVCIYDKQFHSFTLSVPKDAHEFSPVARNEPDSFDSNC